MAQWYSTNSTITDADCSQVCLAAPLCIGYDWANSSYVVQTRLS